MSGYRARSRTRSPAPLLRARSPILDALEARDREIERLNRSLEGGRPHDVVSLEARNRSNERLISHLNLQVDYLQQTNQELEDRIKQLDDAKALAVADNQNLTREVDRLHIELRDIDRLAQQLEREKQDVVVTADTEIHDAKLELRQSQRMEQGAQSRLMDANEERDRLIAENTEALADNEQLKADITRLNGLLDKIQEDKALLADQVSSLQAKEKALVLQLEEYRKYPRSARKRDKSPSKLDAFVKTLEQERDHYKGECEVLQGMLRAGSKKGSRASSPVRSRSPTRTPTKKGGDVSSSDYQMLLRERDELQSMLTKFERHMAEIQANVKVLTQERDKTNVLYEQTADELTRMRRDYVRSPKSPKASLTAQAILRRVENERDVAIADLRRMTTERDSLRERLKIQQETSISERARLEQRSEDLESKVKSLVEEKIELNARVDGLKDLNQAQSDDIKALRMKIVALEDDLLATRTELDEVKSLRAQVEQTLDNTERQLSRKTSECTLAEDRIASLEGRIGELLDTTSKQSDDISGLRATTTALDREKDALQASLDERTERVASLDDLLARRERELSDLRITISGLESKLDRAGDDLSGSEREVRSLQRQLDATRNDLTDTTRQKEVGAREIRRLQDDLSTMTRENQDVTIELDEALREKDELKSKLQDNLTRISSLETLISSKERELADVLDQYRKVTSDRDAAESRYRVATDESNTLRSELGSSDIERKSLTDRIVCLEREISDHLHAQQTYETQIASLTASLANTESDLDRVRADRTNLHNDLASVRDLNAKLDTSKEHVSRQLSGKAVELEQLQANYDDLNRELEIMHKHLDAERAGNKNLEELMAQAREKEFQAQLDAQEQRSEGQLVRDKLALNESKMASMNREVISLRDRVSQLDAELEVAKRHLTNERYERERAVQELRRNGLPSPALSRYGRSLSPSSRPRSTSPSRGVSFADDYR